MKDRIDDFQEFMQLQRLPGRVPDFSLVDANTSLSGRHKNGLDEETERFLAHADVLQQRMVGCQKLIDEMKVRQSEVLIQTNSNDRLEEDLDCLMMRIKDSIKTIHMEINVLQDQCEADDRSWPVERRIKQCQVSVLQRVFQELMYDYNAAQVQHRENCKKRIVRQLEISGENKSEDEVETMLEHGDLNVFYSNLLSETEEARNVLKIVETRHGDIIRLEKSLYELQDLFNEIATTVKRQGEMIDNIEHNVTEAEEALSQAMPVLKAARRYQRRRCLYCCPCLYLCEIM